MVGRPPPRTSPVRNRRAASCNGDRAKAEINEKAPKVTMQLINIVLRAMRSPSNPAQTEPIINPTSPAVSAWVNADG